MTFRAPKEPRRPTTFRAPKETRRPTTFRASKSHNEYSHHQDNHTHSSYHNRKNHADASYKGWVGGLMFILGMILSATGREGRPIHLIIRTTTGKLSHNKG